MARLTSRGELPVDQLQEYLVFKGNKKVDEAIIRLIDFNEDFFEELERLHVDDIPHREAENVTRWISVHGLHNTMIIKELGELFQLHPLTLKNILNTKQRPGVEDYERYLFITFNLVRFNKEEDIINRDQLSLIVGKTFLLSFHEKPIDLFKPIRKRLKVPNGKLRRGGVGYLTYSILDCVLDSYMLAAEEIGKRIEELELQLMKNTTRSALKATINYKREVHVLRKSISPICEHILNTDYLDTGILPKSDMLFFNDLRRHFTQVNEALDAYNEILSDCMSVYQLNIKLRIHTLLRVALFVLALLTSVQVFI